MKKDCPTPCSLPGTLWVAPCFPDAGIPQAAAAWGLDPAITMLNHGSFGACPRAVLEHQRELRCRMAARPVQFLARQMPGMLDASRQRLAATIGADPRDLVFVPNATAGVNSVLRSLRFRGGDEILVTSHGYNACTNVARFVAEQSQATLTVADIPSPVASPAQVVDAIMARVTPRTRLALFDHISSPSAFVFPVEELVDRLDALGIESLIDGAHAPGMVPVDLRRIAPTYYVGNCHKWLCAPWGAGLLYVRRDRQDEIMPPVISHGYNRPRSGYSRFQTLFDWQGTCDPTPWICVGTAIEFLEALLPGGLNELSQRNHQYAVAAQSLLVKELGAKPLCPPEMLGSMAAVELGDDPEPSVEFVDQHPLNQRLFERFGVEVPVFFFPSAPRVVLRVSAQAYNEPAHYHRLVEAVRELWKGRKQGTIDGDSP
jgi:isopenicillin-N epimerase